MNLRGVILAGGKGTRLGELTKVTNKHLLPVGPFPMVFHPLKKLVGAGLEDVLLVSGTEHMGDFVELRGSLIAGIEEKPPKPKSNLAVAGIYLYPPDVFEVIRTLRPSKRGELEITDVNNHYLKENRLGYTPLEGYWTDAGTFESLAHA